VFGGFGEAGVGVVGEVALRGGQRVWMVGRFVVGGFERVGQLAHPKYQKLKQMISKLGITLRAQ
jgi:hypothetical protein